MIILIGESASGKTEVCKALSFKFGYIKFVTTTTRNKRINEIDGIDYFFISKEEFLKKRKNNEFIESVNYSNNFYGSEKKLITEKSVLIVEPNGLKAFKALKDIKIRSYYLKSSEEVRKNRMILRLDKKEDILKRLENDAKEFKKIDFSLIDKIIDSENLSIQEIANIINEDYLNN